MNERFIPEVERRKLEAIKEGPTNPLTRELYKRKEASLIKTKYLCPYLSEDCNFPKDEDCLLNPRAICSK